MDTIRDAHKILWSLLLFSIVVRGTSPGVSATVIIGMGNASALFECKTAVTLRCNAGIYFARWQIAYRLETNTSFSAQCYANQCNVQNNFTGRYTFTYSSSTGISELRIDPVNIEDDEREYKCSGNQQPLKASVKVFPTNSSYALLNATSEKSNDINFTLRLDCTTDNVNITWYFTKENGIEEEINPTYTVRNACPNDECMNSIKSVNISSMLELEKVQAQGQTFSVNVSYDLHTFHIPVQGSYKLKEILRIKTQVSDGKKLVEKILAPVISFIVLVILVHALCCSCKKSAHGYVCKCESRIKATCFGQRKDCGYSNVLCCNEGFDCPKFRVHNVPASIEPMGLRTAPKESITCTLDGEFKNNTVVQLSYTNTETVEKNGRELTADEKQNRPCSSNNLQPFTKCSLVKKASDFRIRTEENVQTLVHHVPASFKTIELRTAPTETSITCTWDKKFESNTVVQLSYTNMETVEKCDRKLTADEKQNRSFTIDNLQPSTKYSIVMKAGDSRTVENVKTLALKPPTWFKFLGIEDDKITVSWEPASSDKNQLFRLTFYQVLHGKEKKETEVFVKYQKPLMKKTVTGLQKNTKYKFEILTFIGTKRSIPQVGFVKTTGKKHALEMQRTGPELITTERHFTPQHFESRTLYDP